MQTMTKLPTLLREVRGAAFPVNAATAASWADHFSPWDTWSEPWLLFCQSLSGPDAEQAALALAAFVDPAVTVNSGLEGQPDAVECIWTAEGLPPRTVGTSLSFPVLEATLAALAQHPDARGGDNP